MYSVSTNFRLELIDPSAREVFIFSTLVDLEKRGPSENMNQWKLATASELKKTLNLSKQTRPISSRRNLVDTLYGGVHYPVHFFACDKIIYIMRNICYHCFYNL